MNDFTPLTQCVVCGASDLNTYLDLGSQPLANLFHDGSNPLESYPLGLNFCSACFHSQQLGVVKKEILYKDYPYASGTTATLKEYFSMFADLMFQRFGRAPLRVLDIASNDGTMLVEFKKRGHIVLGVEPSENLVKMARQNQIPTVNAFWDFGVISPGAPHFDLITALNVLGHVDDPISFLKQCKAVLSKNGRIMIQTSQAKMLAHGEFDTCYHEHISYFNVSSFLHAAYIAGLHVESIEHMPIHGTSYLVSLRHGASDQYPVHFQIGAWESDVGYLRNDLYMNFGNHAHEVACEVLDIIATHREKGNPIIGYGAAAKGMTFINYSGIKLDCIIDDSPLKIGKLTPGSNIPIIGCEEARTNRPAENALFVILAWNFKQEIMTRLRGLNIARPGDKFLTYFPRIELD